MTRDKLPLFTLVAAFGAAAPASADTLARVVERARLDVQPSAQPFKQITIDNPLGDVFVEGYDGASIQIESHKQAPDTEGLDRLRISLVPNPDGTVRITTAADRDRESKPLSRSAVRIDLKVRAPRNARIEASVSAGTLSVSNMDAGGDLDAASGRIKVNNISGELTTHSLSGPTTIVSAFGSVDSQTLSADLDLDSITGDRLVASASQGKIAGRRVRSRDVQLTTNTGKIVLEAETGLRGRIVVSSLRGDVDVKLRRQQMAVVIRAHGATMSFTGVPAAARMPQADGWVEARLGAPGKSAIPAFVEMRSRHGNVQLTALDAE